MTDDEAAQAIKEAVSEAMPHPDEILKAIERGVSLSFPYPGEIWGAIECGVREAVKDGTQKGLL